MADTRKSRPRPIVYLDEIDVLQMVFDAAREYPKENYGLLLGARSAVGKLDAYHVHFVFTVPHTYRGKGFVYPDADTIASFRRSYAFDVLGDFHSHPYPADEWANECPSHDDLEDTREQYGASSLFAVIAVDVVKDFSITKGAERRHPKNIGRIVSRRTRIVCTVDKIAGTTKTETRIMRLRASIHFYVFRDATAIRRNRRSQAHVRRVQVICIRRPKIHGEGEAQ